MKGPRLHASTFLLALLLAVSGLLTGTGVAQTPQLPSPQQHFGHQMGADGKLADWVGLVAYYRLLEKGSDRMKVVELGPSTEGKPFLALFISSPANLSKLEALRQTNAKLADPRGLSEADVKTLVAGGRAVIVQSFALHASEVAASQTAAEYLYERLTRTDEDSRRTLDNVVEIVIPSFNPDGTQMIADWYKKYAGTEYDAAPLPWLYQKYVGHDNNRDAFMQNMIESQHAAKILFRDWTPQAYVDHHQMGGGGARISIPPYAEPVRPDADPLVWREMSWYGGHMGYKLEEAGKTGVIGAAIYSGWGHMGFHWITPFHNIAGMLTESASARLATPVFMHRDQIRGGARGLPTYEAQTTMPSLWEGGWWRVRDMVEYQKIAAWSLVDQAGRNRETLLWNAHLKARRQTERGAAAEVKAYVIPAEQHDPLTMTKMVNKLLDSGVEIHRAPKAFTHEDRVYGEGSYVISMAQPKMGLIRWMLGRTFYPDNTHTRDREGNPIRPYDMSTDTMTEFMGVRSDPAATAVSAELTKLAAHVVPLGQVARGGAGSVIDGRLNDAFTAVNMLLAKNVAVRRVDRAAESLRAGDFLVSAGSDAAVAEVAKTTGVSFRALPAMPPGGTHDLRPMRIALFQRYNGGNMDEGWTRFMLEQFGFPYKSIMDADVKSGGLETRYDVIILPSDSISGMTGEPPPAGQGREFGGPPPANTPPEYRSGFGAEGVKSLEAFVQKGGTLVTFAQAGDLPIQRFGLPIRNVLASLPSKEFWCPGSTLHVRFDNAHHLAYGMPRQGLATFLAGSQAYEVTSTDRSQDVDILATYVERDLLQSGWLLGEQVLARKAAAVSVKHGQGRVVLLGFRPQHRSQTHGTFKLVFDALVTPPTAAKTRMTETVQP
ncbi:MAG: peptidase M14 family protein [Acidobacteria bacterium RIFCSPLOWO2_12_FULL_67_14b]|nr:MAG: peptidase M14 family protein [Acidobacteria bacterium RIFCSPLOWO2_12_FULL_67_14b]